MAEDLINSVPCLAYMELRSTYASWTLLILAQELMIQNVFIDSVVEELTNPGKIPQLFR